MKVQGPEFKELVIDNALGGGYEEVMHSPPP